jgi:hypothetical protein
MAYPTKKSLTPFLYTKDVVNIDVVPSSNNSTYPLGRIISFDSTKAYELGTGGEFQGSEINVIVGDLHNPAYTNADSLKLLGITVEKYPYNYFLYKDMDAELDLVDYSLDVTSFAGSLGRMTVCVMPNIVLVEFWDSRSGGQKIETLVASDIGATVYASQTNGGDTGKAGYASLARSNPNQSAGAVAIGRLLGIPVVNGSFGYILFDPLGARR